MESDTYLERIEINPKIMVGKPIIKGTRIPVELVVRMVAQGISETEILAEYSRLELADIRASLSYAAHIVAQEDIFPLMPSVA